MLGRTERLTHPHSGMQKVKSVCAHLLHMPTLQICVYNTHYALGAKGLECEAAHVAEQCFAADPASSLPEEHITILTVLMNGNLQRQYAQ